MRILQLTVVIAQDKVSTFNSPVVINVLGRVRDYALNVISNVSPSDGDDGLLDKTQQFLNQDTFGDIVIARTELLLLYSSLIHVVQMVLHKDIRSRTMLLAMKDLTILQTRVHFIALDWNCS